MFKITRGKGFQITFQNGWTVSVQFGDGNYCDNYNVSEDVPLMEKNRWAGENGSVTAEIAAWDKDQVWHEFEHGDTVDGHKYPAEVLEFINLVAGK